jgi:signal transduction histidine kinase
MRLADYIEENVGAIVDKAVTFARQQMPGAVHLDDEALRDHLPQILAAVMIDLRNAQSSEDETAKAQGYQDTSAGPLSAAQTHGRLRAKAGFNIDQLVGEYRVLRASVLRLWVANQSADAETVGDMLRFNQAIDQGIAESVAHFSVEAEAWRQLFLGVLGHELRGPLNSILLSAELMSKMTHDVPLSEHTGRLIKSGKRMKALLDDLLDFSRTSLGMGIRITRRDTNLATDLGEEVEVLRAAWPKITLEFDATEQVQGNFDASRLRESLANLVSNAAKYGTADGKVRVVLEEHEGQILLTVKNTGGDIPADTLATMFEPLHRGAESRLHDGSSLGLGLFIVREVAKAHGGEVMVESSSEETTFTMRLPRNPAPIPKTRLS